MPPLVLQGPCRLDLLRPDRGHGSRYCRPFSKHQLPILLAFPHDSSLLLRRLPNRDPLHPSAGARGGAQSPTTDYLRSREFRTEPSCDDTTLDNSRPLCDGSLRCAYGCVSASKNPLRQMKFPSPPSHHEASDDGRFCSSHGHCRQPRHSWRASSKEPCPSFGEWAFSNLEDPQVSLVQHQGSFSHLDGPELPCFGLSLPLSPRPQR